MGSTEDERLNVFARETHGRHQRHRDSGGDNERRERHDEHRRHDETKHHERRRRRDESRSRSRSPNPRHERRRRSRSPRGEFRHERKPDDHRAFPDGYKEPTRLFVGGVPKVTTEERFRAHFERFGRVIRVELNASRSFGFVTFADTRAVEKALEQRMHSFNHSGSNVAFIEVRRPLPKKRARLRSD